MGKLKDFWDYGFMPKETRNLERRDLEYVSSFSDALQFGQLFNNSKAMNLSAVYRCTELISDSVAMLPIYVSKEDLVIDNHPVALIFSDNGNNILSKFNFIKLLIQSVILKGNGFAYISRANDGRVTNLRFLEASDVIINYDKYKNILYYTCDLISRGKKIEPINMIHLFKNSYDGVNGISVLSYATRTIGNANATENSAKAFFDNGANLSGVLTVQGQLSAKQKEDIRSSWTQAYANGGNGLAVLQGNMTYQPIQLSSADAQMIESRQFNVEDIARFFGVNPLLLGLQGSASYASLEMVQNDFLVHTLQPYITMVEAEFTRKLLKPSEMGLKVNLDENAILRVDKAAQANYYGSLLDKGVLSIDEVRKELGYQAIGLNEHIIPYTDINQNTVNGKGNNNDDKKDSE